MENHKKTKIVATIGPASDSPERIAELISAGVNVFRFNMKHATIDWHNERISLVRKVAIKLDAPIAVLVDLQGPEIRLETKDQQEFPIAKGEKILMSEKLAGKVNIRVPHKEFFETLGVGDFFLIDDGAIELVIRGKKNDVIIAQALNDGVIKHRKGINIPGKNIDLPSLIRDDLQKLNMVAKNKVDFVGLSFSRTEKDIETLRRELDKRGIRAGIVAKIESRQALDNLDDLIGSADAVMVARGDLGIEIPIEELTYSQKKIVKKCRLAKKPVIIATQMLQSMIKNPRPTRAEANDVANAVYDGADAVMLSEETSAGKYPLKSVQAMARIVKFNEHKNSSSKMMSEPKDLKQQIINAAMSIISDKFRSDIGAVVVFTETGYTARILSSFHPKTQIIAITDRPETMQSLILSYGIMPFYMRAPIKITQPTEPIVKILLRQKIVKKGQNVLFVHGEHRKSKGPISSISLVSVK